MTGCLAAMYKVDGGKEELPRRDGMQILLVCAFQQRFGKIVELKSARGN